MPLSIFRPSNSQNYAILEVTEFRREPVGRARIKSVSQECGALWEMKFPEFV